MKNEILKLLENDAKLSAAQIAAMLGREVADVEATIKELEESNTILGYNTVIDWEKTNREYVTAMIEVKLTPQRDRGYDKIAEKIYKYPEVQAVYLMSGGAYDLSILIEGKTMKEVSFFVSQKLAPTEAVISTATHFVLHKYKDKGVLYAPNADPDERGNCN